MVLDGIDLDIAEGTTFSLLGPNGAGKTTTVQNPLDTSSAPTRARFAWRVSTWRREPDAVRAAIGVTGQFSAVDNLLTGEENLMLMADLHHLDRARGVVAPRLLERFDLVEPPTQMAATYSGGMRRRLDLAMTLMGDPRIIFLDEPTTGLDPRSRRTMWQIIRDLSPTGVTIFLTTQYLEEADQLADQIAVLDHGRLRGRGHTRTSSSAGSRRSRPAVLPGPRMTVRARASVCGVTRQRRAHPPGPDRR